MLKLTSCAVFVAICLALSVSSTSAQEDAPSATDRARKLAVGKAWDYLKTMYNRPAPRDDRAQLKAGWGPKSMNVPYTALVLQGLRGSEVWSDDEEMINQSVTWLIESQEAGGDWAFTPGIPQAKGMYAVYVTSIVAQLFTDLNADGAWKGKLNDAVAKARDYLKQSQVGDPDGPAADFKKEESGFGGWAYSKEEIGQGKKPASNMSTSTFAIDALHACGVKEGDPMWERALVFLKRNHNAGEVHDEGWVAKDGKGRTIKPAGKDDPAYGGATYAEEASEGATENADGTVTLGSYGSMTYNLLRSYLFAGLKKDSIPVKLALGWIQRNYTVDRAAGFKSEKDYEKGLYYYYMSMAKTLKVLGMDTINEPERDLKHDWRKDLVKAIAGRQQSDGSWVNTNPAWQETSPVLCTAYALEALRNTR